MKTTIEINDDLLRRAKDVARRRSTTLRAIVEEALRASLAKPQPRKPYRMRDCSWGHGGLQPGIDLHNWEQIRAIIYEGHGE